MHEEITTVVIQEEEAGERLDKVLASRFSEVKSRTYFQRLLGDKRVLVNGSHVKKRTKLSAGDTVEVSFTFSEELSLDPEPIPLDILYEDENILVINKPCGMVVHPAPGNWTGTFVNALLYHCREMQAREKKHFRLEDPLPRPGIVHRLDKETSGVLIAAKNSTAQERLIHQFANRQVGKRYRVICLGNPGTGEINAPLARHLVYRQKMTVVEEGGKEAISRLRPIAYDGTLAEVEVELLTGRTHQIRVHLAHRGTHVLGDSVYGSSQWNKKLGVERQLLHAHLLQIQHPMTGESLEFEAPIPEDMKAWIKKIGRESRI